MSSLLPTPLLQQAPPRAASSSASSSSSSDSLTAPPSELDDPDDNLSKFYSCVSASLLQYCIGCCSGSSGVSQSAHRLKWRRQIKHRIERRFYHLLGRRLASAQIVARVFCAACTRAIAEVADRLGGRGWTSERVSDALNQMISPLLADLGVPDHSAQLSIQLPSFSLYSSSNSFKRQRMNYAVRLPELLRLLRPFNELVTLLWTLNAEGILQIDLVAQLTSLASSSARRAIAQFPIQLVDCLASMAEVGFTLLAGTPTRHRQVQLCTNRYVASTLWPLYCRLLLRLVSEHIADWVSSQLNKRLQASDVDSMVAEAQARLKWYSDEVRADEKEPLDQRPPVRSRRRPTPSRKSYRPYRGRALQSTKRQQYSQQRPNQRPSRRSDANDAKSSSRGVEARYRRGGHRDGSGGFRESRYQPRDHQSGAKRARLSGDRN